MKKENFIEKIKEFYSFKGRMTKTFSTKNKPIIKQLRKETSFLDPSSGMVERAYCILNNIIEIPKCKNCAQNNVKWDRNNRKYREYCSVKCSTNSKEHKTKITQTNLKKYGTPVASMAHSVKIKAKQTNLKKYKVEHPSQNAEIKEKAKQTNLERYGVYNSSQSNTSKEKAKQTNLERYGVEYTGQYHKTKEKVRKTILKKYGVGNVFQDKETKNRIKQKNLERYGVDCPLKNEEIQKKIKLTNIKKYGVDNVFKSKTIQEQIKLTNKKKYGSKIFNQRMIPEATIDNLNSYEWVYNQHINLKKPLIQIAKDLKVSDVTIGNYLKKHNIETRLYRNGFLCEKFFNDFPEAKNKNSFFYIIEMVDENEHFIKIGITTTTIQRRYKHVPYKIQNIETIRLPLYISWFIEQFVLHALHDKIYKPKKDFGGRTECLSMECKEYLHNIIFELTNQ